MAEQVSGPSKFAKRTDKNTSKQPMRYMSGGTYGSGGLMTEQSGAPMAGKPNTSIPNVAYSPSMMESVVPLSAPTQRPDEPLSAGMSFGAGPGSEVLDLPMPEKPSLQNVLSELMKYDETGDVAQIYNSVINKGI
jgi:hypothetical protein